MTNLTKNSPKSYRNSELYQSKYLNYPSTRKNCDFSNYLLQLVYLTDIYERSMSLDNADKEQKTFYN